MRLLGCLENINAASGFRVAAVAAVAADVVTSFLTLLLT